MSRNFSEIAAEDKNRIDIFKTIDFDDKANLLSEVFVMSHAELDDMTASVNTVNRKIDILFTSMHTQCERFHQNLEYKK